MLQPHLFAVNLLCFPEHHHLDLSRPSFDAIANIVFLTEGDDWSQQLRNGTMFALQPRSGGGLVTIPHSQLPPDILWSHLQSTNLLKLQPETRFSLGSMEDGRVLLSFANSTHILKISIYLNYLFRHWFYWCVFQHVIMYNLNLPSPRWFCCGS